MDYKRFEKFREFAVNQHDVVCNQKYGDMHPYSFHLDLVVSQVKQFYNDVGFTNVEKINVLCGAIGHDLIEDARVTYNDIKHRVGDGVADIIYCCTEEKGKNRDERHSEKYFNELKENELAVFVKLCDIIANVKYSLLTNSSMYNKYKKEYPKVKEKLYIDRYQELFVYLEKLLNF
jgi:(p)ppGpp synthase/HD superfamily hydrolase